MHRLRTLLTIMTAGAASLAALAAAPSAANATDVDVHVYRRPIYVAPARVVRVGPYCTVRRTRIWTGYRYIYRTVRHCF